MKTTINEDRGRRIVATGNNIDDQRASGVDQARGRVEVKIAAASPPTWAGEVLRAIADRIEKGD
jgi:hypothetical protein